MVWGWCSPASLNSFPALPLCLAPSLLPWRQSGWGQAKVAEQWPSPWPAPVHTHPVPWCLGMSRRPSLLQDAQHLSGTYCVLAIFLYTAALWSLTTACKVAGVLEEEAAQRCEATCLRSHSKSVESCSSSSKAQTLPHVLSPPSPLACWPSV